jgi:polysaccharide deacetylase family protein (PEP-CTERM system associated)
MPEKRIPKHCLSVDVEDYFHVAAFRNSVRLGDWGNLPSRVQANTAKVLDLFDELGVKATFFVLGWVAEKYPEIVRQISRAGHELGCHSFSHQLIYEIGPDAFRQDTMRALDAIQQASGERVTLYRAPSFSITRRSLWALEILSEAGFTHDSSIFPIRHDLYGFPDAPRRPFAIRLSGGGQLIEFPPSTVKFAGATLPVTGGGYLRVLPVFYQRKALRVLERSATPGMVYLHPWELDPEQPRIKAPLRSRFRHYTGLSRTASRIRKLSTEFHFAKLTETVPDQLPVFELQTNGEFRSCAGERVSAAVGLKSGTELQEGAKACL